MAPNYEDIDEPFEVRIASLIDPKVMDDRREEFKASFEKLRKIGDGSEGDVFKMEHRETKQIVAVKKMKQHFHRKSNQPIAHHELRMFHRVDQIGKSQGRDHILRLVAGEWYPCTPKSGGQMLVMEYCGLGTLRGWLVQHCAQRRTRSWRAPHEGQLRHFYLQMLKAIAFLHCGWGTDAFDRDAGRVPGHKPLLHRDIKPDNILVCSPPDGTLTSLPTLKLADFGGAWQCAVPQPPQGQSLYFFSDGYIAPEFLKGPLSRDEANEGSGIFALGATMHWAIFADKPFKEIRQGRGQRSKFVYRRLDIEKARHRGEDPISPDFSARLNDALAESPPMRRTAYHILQRLQQSHAEHVAEYERWWHEEEVPYMARLAAEEQQNRDRLAAACNLEVPFEPDEAQASPAPQPPPQHRQESEHYHPAPQPGIAQDCICHDHDACCNITNDEQYLRADRHACWHEYQVEMHRGIWQQAMAAQDLELAKQHDDMGTAHHQAAARQREYIHAVKMAVEAQQTEAAQAQQEMVPQHRLPGGVAQWNAFVAQNAAEAGQEGVPSSSLMDVD